MHQSTAELNSLESFSEPGFLAVVVFDWILNVSSHVAVIAKPRTVTQSWTISSRSSVLSSSESMHCNSRAHLHCTSSFPATLFMTLARNDSLLCDWEHRMCWGSKTRTSFSTEERKEKCCHSEGRDLPCWQSQTTFGYKRSSLHLHPHQQPCLQGILQI